MERKDKAAVLSRGVEWGGGVEMGMPLIGTVMVWFGEEADC
jgi:hypothetical protein